MNRFCSSKVAPTKDTLIAFGDSWFDYSRWACDSDGKTDVLQELRVHGFQVVREALQGTRIRDTSSAALQLSRLRGRIEEQLRSGRNIKAILLSGGGNDIADQFFRLLNPARQGEAWLNEEMMFSLIDRKIRNAFVNWLSSINKICLSANGLQRMLPILIHGYDYPIPDGRGHCLPFKTPWLAPVFQKQGYNDLELRVRCARHIIDRFNTMLACLPQRSELSNVQYVDLLGTLPGELEKWSYRRYWENELHPTRQGWVLISRKFKEVLARLD